MNTVRPALPTLTVNRRFMMDFIAREPPCLALGLVEVEGSQCAMITLHLSEALPREVSAAGFVFGHTLYGGDPPGLDHNRRPVPPGDIVVRAVPRSAWHHAHLGLPEQCRLSRSGGGSADAEARVRRSPMAGLGASRQVGRHLAK
jgi:hypothetical protein